MLIVDAQVHVWGANRPERPWPVDGQAPHRPAFSSAELLQEMGAAGVDRVVIVPPSWEGDRNDLGLEAARLHSDRFAVMGRLDIDAPDARGRFANWRLQPGMMGMRFTFFKTHTELLNHWVWAEAEATGVPLMVVAHAPHWNVVERVAQRHPGLKLIIDHLGIPTGKKDAEAFGALDKLLTLAKFPNIAVKASALPTNTSDVYPYLRIHHHIRSVYNAFGPKRMFWGTDLTKLPCSYRQAVTMFTEEIPWLTTADKEWIMGRGICEWIGWKYPQG